MQRLRDEASPPRGDPLKPFMNRMKLESGQQNVASLFRVPQKEVGKRSSIIFFRFQDSFGHFLVTFSDASVTFFVTFLLNSFCQTPFAAG